MKFSEIWYVDASHQKKMLQKNFFWISAFLGRFLTKKQPKKNSQKKLPKSKPHDNWSPEIFSGGPMRSVLSVVRPCVCPDDNGKTNERIFMKFGI